MGVLLLGQAVRFLKKVNAPNPNREIVVGSGVGMATVRLSTSISPKYESLNVKVVTGESKVVSKLPEAQQSQLPGLLKISTPSANA